MRRKAATIPDPDPDPGLAEIDRWTRWFVGAQREVIAAQDLQPAQRAAALVEADRLAAAVSARMRHDYLVRTRTPR